MDITLRSANPEDIAACAHLCYDAFLSISEAHNFPSDYPTVDSALSLVEYRVRHPEFLTVVAEAKGRVVACNFLDERSTVFGVGPLAVVPDMQNKGIGRSLLVDAARHTKESGAAGMRLTQTAYHSRSFSLYTKLDFRVRDVLACMRGTCSKAKVSGHDVRSATEADRESCDALCRRTHGHDRSRELDEAVRQGTAVVVERGGRITGYATDLSFRGHAVGEDNTSMKALMSSAGSFGHPGILVPLSNGDLTQWCLERGLRAGDLHTLMSSGMYQTPKGPYLPSALF
ncbi:GNAT family N-acetyltransferase [Streptomyces sp. SCSIO 30461]|uniref:GNAT family N-acetyltransferase n=1 Tax=Streptomyces sp. SCSIO 30461 TaxID=3118085 RepID=UPI0030D4CB9F